MTQKVTVSEFREKLADYISFLLAGGKIELTNGKKGKRILTLTKEKEEEFDWDEHLEWVKNMKPVFTDEDVKKIEAQRRRSKERLKRLNW